MSASVLDPNVAEVDGGYVVHRPDGTFRTVFPRPVVEPGHWAVFSGGSTFEVREPRLGYSGSWGGLDHAIAWAKEAT